MLRGCKALVLPLTTLMLVMLTGARATAQSGYFDKWPAGTSPKEVGKRVAENFVARKLEVEEGKRKYVIYPEVCAWYGSLTVAQLTKDQDLKERLIAKFNPLLSSEGAPRGTLHQARPRELGSAPAQEERGPSYDD